LLASMFRFSHSELGTTLSGFSLSRVIAILLVLNLLAGLL